MPKGYSCVAHVHAHGEAPLSPPPPHPSPVQSRLMRDYAVGVTIIGSKHCTALQLEGKDPSSLVFTVNGTKLDHDKSLRMYIDSNDIEEDDYMSDTGKRITIDIRIKK